MVDLDIYLSTKPHHPHIVIYRNDAFLKVLLFVSAILSAELSSLFSGFYRFKRSSRYDHKAACVVTALFGADL